MTEEERMSLITAIEEKIDALLATQNLSEEEKSAVLRSALSVVAGNREE